MLQSDIPLKMTKVQWIFVRKLLSDFLEYAFELSFFFELNGGQNGE